MDPAIRRDDDLVVLRADLREDGVVRREAADVLQLLVVGDLNRPVRDLDVGQAKLIHEAEPLVQLALTEADLEERAAEDDHDPFVAVAVELLTKVRGDIRRPPAEFHDVDVVAGRCEESLDLRDRKPLVHHMRDPRLARSRGALGQVEKGGRRHFAHRAAAAPARRP